VGQEMAWSTVITKLNVKSNGLKRNRVKKITVPMLQPGFKENPPMIYKGLNWTFKNKKGMTDKSIFVTMFTTFIIVIYDIGEDLP
jgi:hypothetical protein